MFRVTGPAVHRLLEQFGLTAADVPATGPKGNLLKGDILNVISQKGLQPKPPKSGTVYNSVLGESPVFKGIFIVSLPGGATESAAAAVASKPAKAGQPKKAASKFVDVELTSMRKTIAKRLTQSKVKINPSSAMNFV